MITSFITSSVHDSPVCLRCADRVVGIDFTSSVYMVIAPGPEVRCARCGVDRDGDYDKERGAFAFPPERVRLHLPGYDPAGWYRAARYPEDYPDERPGGDAVCCGSCAPKVSRGWQGPNTVCVVYAPRDRAVAIGDACCWCGRVREG